MSEFSIPDQGIEKNTLLKQLKEYGINDSDWRSGKVFSLVYHLDDEHSQFLKDAFTTYFSENGLNPMAFKSLKRFEHEVIKMSVNLLNGSKDTVGTFTSGGTESIITAVRTYKDYFLSKRKWIKGIHRYMRPEMILPDSAHPAFRKAAHYFDIKVV